MMDPSLDVSCELGPRLYALSSEPVNIGIDRIQCLVQIALLHESSQSPL
jgi:hypothetical protein